MFRYSVSPTALRGLLDMALNLERSAEKNFLIGQHQIECSAVTAARRRAQQWLTWFYFFIGCKVCFFAWECNCKLKLLCRGGTND
jgi:hypothetical protein